MIAPCSNDYYPNTIVARGEWTHLVWRYNVSTLTMSVAVNGVIQSEGNHSPFLGVAPVLVGTLRPNPTPFFYNGSIDEVRR